LHQNLHRALRQYIAHAVVPTHVLARDLKQGFARPGHAVCVQIIVPWQIAELISQKALRIGRFEQACGQQHNLLPPAVPDPLG